MATLFENMGREPETWIINFCGPWQHKINAYDVIKLRMQMIGYLCQQ